jgi:hypothetical protein
MNFAEHTRTVREAGLAKAVSYNVSTHTRCAAELDSVSGAKEMYPVPYRDGVDGKEVIL